MTIRKRNRSVFWLIFVACTIIGFSNFEKLEISATGEAAKPQAKKSDIVTNESPSEPVKFDLTPILNKYSGIDVSVTLIDINSGAKQNYGSNEPYKAASVTKLITAAMFLNETETGRATLEETIGGFSAKEQLSALINQSNNASWTLLEDRLGKDNISAYARRVGITSFDFDKNTISSPDTALLLQKLAKGELLNQTNSELMLGWMKNTVNEDLIPTGLPSGASAAHKYGLVGNNVHDAGVITRGDSRYVLVIFTNSQSPLDYENRKALFADITSLLIK